MGRIRSPNYPAISLAETLKRVGQLHARERQHMMAREVVVKGMGYSGVNGASLGALSAGVKYGLLDQAGKGQDYRVSDRAVAILHPHTPGEKAEALRAAARSPALFAELLDHFKGGLPSDDNLRAYLVRRGFSQSSLSNVIQAFRDTMELVSPEPAEYSGRDREPTQSVAMHSASKPADRAPPPPPTGREPYRVSITPEGLEVVARLSDTESIERLIQILRAGKALITPVDGPFDTGEPEQESENQVE